MATITHIFYAIDLGVIILMIASYLLRYKRLKNIAKISPSPEFEYIPGASKDIPVSMARREDLASSTKHILLRDGTIWLVHYDESGYCRSATRGHTNESFEQYRCRITQSIEAENLQYKFSVLKEMLIIGLFGNIYLWLRLTIITFG